MASKKSLLGFLNTHGAKHMCPHWELQQYLFICHLGKNAH